MEMNNDTMFAKYITDLCNNPELINAVINAHKVAFIDNSDDANDLFASTLVDLCGYQLAQEIMNIHDVIYGNGERMLNVDPSYNDAEVKDEPTPKNEVIAFFQAVHPQGNLGEEMKSIRQRIHDLKFNPIGAINQNRIKSELEQLSEMEMPQSPYYKRW